MKEAMAPPGLYTKPLSTQVGVALGAGLLVLAVMLIASIFRQVDIAYMTRDVASIAQISPLTGMLSNLGVLLWCATAAISGATALLLWRSGDMAASRFFIASFLLTTYLLLDDLFLIHEYLAFRYLGLRERYVLLFLGLALASWLIGFRGTILRTPFGYLLVALGFFAVSVLVDGLLVRLFPHLEDDDLVFLAEDGAKWMGITSWTTYHVSCCLRKLQRKLKLG